LLVDDLLVGGRQGQVVTLSVMLASVTGAFLLISSYDGDWATF
jgi:hypothetical protein